MCFNACFLFAFFNLFLQKLGVFIQYMELSCFFFFLCFVFLTFPPLLLRIKILEMFSEQSLHSVLSRLIEPPRTESLQASKVRLRDLGALTPEEKLTPLGYHLASLPVDVRIGKLMLFGTIFRCLDPALTIAASLAFKSPFVSICNPRAVFLCSSKMLLGPAARYT